MSAAPRRRKNRDGLSLLLLGGSGFVGRALLRELAARVQQSPDGAGLRVRALLRQPDALPDLPFLEKVRGSLESPPRDLEPSRPYVLVNLAVKQLDLDGTGYRRTNVTATGRLLERLGPRLSGAIYASSMSVYGQGAQEGVDESCPTAPGTPLSESRALAEAQLRSFAERRGIASIALRPRFILGEGDRFVLPGLAKLVRRGLGIGPGSQRFSVIHVEDHARVIASLASAIAAGADSPSPLLRAYNVGYTRPVSFAEIASLLAQALHVPAARWRIPVHAGVTRALRRVPSTRVDALATRLELIGLSHWADTRALASAPGGAVALADPLAALRRAVASLTAHDGVPHRDSPFRFASPTSFPLESRP